MPKHLTMTRRDGEDRDAFLDRVSAQVAEHFSEDAPAAPEVAEVPATDAPAEEPAETEKTESAPTD